MTPQTGYTDFSALQYIGKTSLKMSYTSEKKQDSTLHTVIISNSGKTVAFQVHLRVLKGRSGDDILPVLFSDNYIQLAPGETRTILCSYANKDAKNTQPFFVTSAWNLDLTKCKATPKMGFEDQN
jgi:exo-1,4-beta-D-glucosaminidase